MSSLLIEMVLVAGIRKGDVLTMPCGPESTLRDVQKFVNSELAQDGVSIFLQERGVLVPNEADLLSKTLHESLCTSSRLPVFVHEGKSFPVFVTNLTDKALTIYVYKSYSVSDLKKQIRIKEGFPLHRQRLIYAGRQLEDARSLHDYAIGENSTIHLVLRLRGGGPSPPLPFSLVDIANDHARVDVAWSDDAPDWRRVDGGFAIEGICKKNDCTAFGKHVICSKGFGCFRLDAVIPKCPICKCRVHSNNMGFNYCFYRIRAMKKGSSIEISVPWTKVENYYRTWDEREAGVIEWEHMEIAVRSLAHAKTVPGPSRREAPFANECAICFRKCYGVEDIHMLRYCHSYHTVCWKGWSDTCRSKNREVTCPLCRMLVESE